MTQSSWLNLLVVVTLFVAWMAGGLIAAAGLAALCELALTTLEMRRERRELPIRIEKR